MTVAARLRLLIDACLTPTCVPRLHQTHAHEVDAVHVDTVLPRGTSDAEVLAYAAAQTRVLVTANSADFLALVRSQGTHPGLLLVADQDTRERQVEAVRSLVSSILVWLDAGNNIEGHVFTLRRTSGKLAARTLP